MQCLNQAEQKSWLLQNGIPENPYSNATQKFYLQFYSPQDFRTLQFFINGYLEIFPIQPSALVVVTDWATYEPFEMKLIETLRLAYSEKRPLIEASGHLFNKQQKDEVVGMFSLATAFCWSSYLYLPDQKTTLFNWEGEIMDFWTDSPSHHKAMCELIARFKLKETPKKKI